MGSKFVQFQAVATKEGNHVLYALDEAGQGWVYDGPNRCWLALGTEQLVPQSAGHGSGPGPTRV